MSDTQSEKKYIIHLKCDNCKETDAVISTNAKEWKCPFCSKPMSSEEKK